MVYRKRLGGRRRGGKRRGARRGIRRRANKSGGLLSYKLGTLVPDRMTLKLSYKDNINMSSITSPFVNKVMRLNSIYDPDTSVTNGHQPLGYDQWQTFYNRYRVYAATVRVSVINNQTGAVQCGFIPYNSQVAPAMDDSIFEQPHAVSKTAGGVAGINKVVLYKKVYIPRILGKNSTQHKAANSTSAIFGANPTEECWGMIVCRAVNDSTYPTAVAVVDITYHVELFDRNAQTLSYPDGKNPDGEFIQEV